MPATFTRRRRAPGLGESVLRPDAPPKVRGEFAFSSDLYVDGMVWGKTVRSPYPHARIVGIDITGALAMPGVHAVVTQDDLWGSRTYGLEHHDQPVFADDMVRFHGEPVAAVAADHPELAARACAAITVEYEVLEPLVDAEAAITAPPIHPDGNVFRHVRLRHGDPEAIGDVVVEGSYEVGMQDQAFLGPESGLAVPAEDGGVELFVATQWLHVDRDQIAACLDLPREKVRLSLAGVGGAFGGREDLSPADPRLPARARHRPAGEDGLHPRGVVLRPRPPAPGAASGIATTRRRDGTLVNVEARMVLRRRRLHVVQHGGHRQRDAASPPGRTTSRTRWSTATRCARTTRPAARCAASVRCRPASPHEAQMDKLAAALRDGPGRAAPEERAEDATTS